MKKENVGFLTVFYERNYLKLSTKTSFSFYSFLLKVAILTLFYYFEVHPLPIILLVSYYTISFVVRFFVYRSLTIDKSNVTYIISVFGFETKRLSSPIDLVEFEISKIMSPKGNYRYLEINFIEQDKTGAINIGRAWSVKKFKQLTENYFEIKNNE